MELTGAEIAIRCLEEEGVKHIFGYPGGAVLYIYDALYSNRNIQHILVRHEQAAVHAADAYSRTTQEVGVCLVTSGPGVTNAVTGIATAYMDSVPMVIISGQVPTNAIGEDAFQECDAVGITRPCVKHNFLVKDVRDLAATFKKAFHIARTGRPGPVLIDIPKDVSRDRCGFSYPKTVAMRSYNPVVKGHQGQLKKAMQLILAAERPLIYVGGGVILGNASKVLNELVDQLGFPCTTTLMGLGAYRSSDSKWIGMPGMHGTYEANMTMHRCAGGFVQRGRRHQQQGTAELVGADQRVAQARLPGLRPRKPEDQAAVRGREALPGHARRRHHHLRCGAAPDVCGAVLPLRQAAPLGQFRRSGHDGRGSAVRHGGGAGQSGRAGGLHHR